MSRKILIDFQGVQTKNSAGRGIGRYSEDFLESLIDPTSSNTYILLVNESFLTKEVKNKLNKLLLIKNTKVIYWKPLTKTGYLFKEIESRKSSIAIYETAIRAQSPDLVVVLSGFEGLTDDAVFKVCDGIPTHAILYDIIPYLYKETYLSNSDVSDWYLYTISELKKCQKLYGISNSAATDAVREFNFDPDKIDTLKAG